jgi:hypothetical protein
LAKKKSPNLLNLKIIHYFHLAIFFGNHIKAIIRNPTSVSNFGIFCFLVLGGFVLFLWAIGGPINASIKGIPRCYVIILFFKIHFSNKLII